MAALGLAVIGCGFQGAIHADNAVASPNVDLVACADLDTGLAASIAGRTGSTAASVEEVWENPSVKAVVIATTTHTHHELALAAAAHGKHMLLEKPMALTVDECLEIEQAAAAANVRLMLGYKFRFTAASVAARVAVPRPGVLTAHTMYDPAPPGASSWVNDRSLSGGRMVSSLVHSIDLLRFLAGAEIVRVYAEGASVVHTELPDPDNAVATLLFDNGAIASIVHGTSAANAVVSTWSFQSASVGVNATVHQHGRRLSVHRSDVERQSPDVVDECEDPFRAGTAPLLEAFVAAVRGTGPISPDGRDGTISLQVARCIEDAMATGAPQDVPGI